MILEAQVTACALFFVWISLYRGGFGRKKFQYEKKSQLGAICRQMLCYLGHICPYIKFLSYRERIRGKNAPDMSYYRHRDNLVDITWWVALNLLPMRTFFCIGIKRTYLAARMDLAGKLWQISSRKTFKRKRKRRNGGVAEKFGYFR